MSGAGALARVPVAILAGGLGTRLRPAIGDAQKVVAEVRGRPFLAWLLDAVERSGFRDVVLCVGHRADAVEAALGARHGALRLAYSREPAPLGTAGALRRALPLLDGEAILVLNGDSFCDADLAETVRVHRDRRPAATLVVVEVDDTARYGRVELDGEGWICRFVEKQVRGGPGWINAGIYAFDRERLAALPEGRALSLERDVLPGWVAAPLPAGAVGPATGLFGHRVRARFIDIGTPRAYADASRFFVSEDREAGS